MFFRRAGCACSILSSVPVHLYVFVRSYHQCICLYVASKGIVDIVMPYVHTFARTYGGLYK